MIDVYHVRISDLAWTMVNIPYPTPTHLAIVDHGLYSNQHVGLMY